MLRSSHLKTHAFTLLEMSIVLTIIGLIIGGIITGQSLVNGAKLQNIITEKEELVFAMKQFQEKYNGLPGDLYNASSYWPEDTTDTVWDGSTSDEVENGNGNGKIAAVVATDGYEAHQAWKQMALAGLIEGNYTGAYTGTPISVIPGTEVPKTGYDDATGWHLYYVGARAAADTDFFQGSYGHALYLGQGSFSDTAANKGAMGTDDIASLEVKIDDGNPATGNIRSGKSTGTFGGACISTAVASTAAYVADQVACIPIFMTGIN